MTVLVCGCSNASGPSREGVKNTETEKTEDAKYLLTHDEAQESLRRMVESYLDTESKASTPFHRNLLPSMQMIHAEYYENDPEKARQIFDDLINNSKQASFDDFFNTDNDAGDDTVVRQNDIAPETEDDSCDIDADDAFDENDQYAEINGWWCNLTKGTFSISLRGEPYGTAFGVFRKSNDQWEAEIKELCHGDIVPR